MFLPQFKTTKDKSYWITSDTHFGDPRFLYYSNPEEKRPFSNVDEMNATIIKNFNELILPDDILFHLGDFAKGTSDEIIKFRESLACKNIHLILGNHDYKHQDLYESLFTSVHHYLEVFVGDSRICMFHYPIQDWNKMHRYSAYHVHGHLHSRTNRTACGRWDIGVDASGFIPLNLRQTVLALKEDVLLNGEKDIVLLNS